MKEITLNWSPYHDSGYHLLSDIYIMLNKKRTKELGYVWISGSWRLPEYVPCNIMDCDCMVPTPNLISGCSDLLIEVAKFLKKRGYQVILPQFNPPYTVRRPFHPNPSIQKWRIRSAMAWRK